MVEDIKLIKNWDVAHLQDTLLITFWRYVTETVGQLLEEQGSADVVSSDKSSFQPPGALPSKLLTAAVELLAAIAAMNEAYMQVNTKAMSAEIKQKDDERDSLLRGVKQMVAAYVRVAPSEAQHVAAVALQQSITDFCLDPRQSYLLENTILCAWLDAVADSPELSQAAALLGLSDSLRRLGELCTEVDSLITERNAEVLRKRSMQQRLRRKESEARWRTFVLVLNAAAVMDPDEQRYEDFVQVMNLELKNLKRQMRHMRKLNPRRRGAAVTSQTEYLE